MAEASSPLREPASSLSPLYAATRRACPNPPRHACGCASCPLRTSSSPLARWWRTLTPHANPQSRSRSALARGRRRLAQQQPDRRESRPHRTASRCSRSRVGRRDRAIAHRRVRAPKRSSHACATAPPSPTSSSLPESALRFAQRRASPQRLSKRLRAIGDGRRPARASPSLRHLHATSLGHGEQRLPLARSGETQ
jgi:hypothetical protein